MYMKQILCKLIQNNIGNVDFLLIITNWCGLTNVNFIFRFFAH